MKYLLLLCVLVGIAVVCVDVWRYFHPAPTVDPRYEHTQLLLTQTLQTLDVTQHQLHATRDTIQQLEQDKQVVVARAAAAEDSANRLRARLTPPPPMEDSTSPQWMHRSRQLEAENRELRFALMDKDTALRSDSAEIHLYQLQLRSDSLTQAETRGAVTEAQHTLVDEHVAATDKGKLWGFLPLPSRKQSYIAGALSLFVVSQAAKHVRL